MSNIFKMPLMFWIMFIFGMIFLVLSFFNGATSYFNSEVVFMIMAFTLGLVFLNDSNMEDLEKRIKQLEKKK